MTKIGIALVAVMSVSLCARVRAQTAAAQTAPDAATPKKVKKTKQKSVQEQIDELRVSMQTQIDELKKQLAERDAQLQAMQKATQGATSQATDASMDADAANAKAAQKEVEIKALQTQAGAASAGAAIAISSSAENTKQIHAMESPVAIHYKNVTLTPKGYIAAESVWRERAMGTDISTPFNATPYMNAGQAHVSEFNGTARQSQIGLLMQGSVPFAKLSGYVETDFLGVGVNSNNSQSGSYALRLRQAWAQMTHGGFTFTGGQMWSLVTETKHGVGPGSEDPPPVIDPAYHVGFSWARQYGLRASQQVTSKIAVAASVEESQILFSELGTSTANAPTNFFFGSVGGGDQNTTASYTDNLAPDVIVKAAYDPGFGHFEVGGMARFFRDRYYPGAAVGPPSNHTETGGALLFNARIPATKFLDVDLHMLTGEGVGRYGASGLPDVTVKPSGTLEPLRGDQGLLSLIAHPTPKLDILGIAGGEYVQRTFYRNATNGTVGYAPPDAPNGSCNTESGTTNGTGYGPGTGNANCTGATRAILSGTVGWTYRIYNGTRGKVQYSVMYTYLTREAWAGLNAAVPTPAVAAPKGTNNMIYSSFRYYIP